MATIAFMPTRKLLELLSKPENRDGYVRILTATRLGLGPDPLQPKMIIDFSKEQVSPNSSEEIGVSFPLAGNDRVTEAKSARRSGDYWFELNDRRIDCRSLKELLAEGLKAIEKRRPGTLEKLSHIKPRTRRIVAHEPRELFDQAHLSKQFAEKLINGWYYGTNNSAHETNTWLERACSCGGLKWAIDFKTSLTLPPAELDDL
jgi:hypothetical protein